MYSCNTCDSITKKNPGINCVGFCGGAYHANGTCCDVKKGLLAVINGLPGAG